MDLRLFVALTFAQATTTEDVSILSLTRLPRTILNQASPISNERHSSAAQFHLHNNNTHLKVLVSASTELPIPNIRLVLPTRSETSPDRQHHRSTGLTLCPIALEVPVIHEENYDVNDLQTRHCRATRNGKVFAQVLTKCVTYRTPGKGKAR